MSFLKINVRNFIICASIIGFILHLAWEYLQCSPFYIHAKVLPTLWSMLKVTLGDVIILWTSFFVVTIFRKKLLASWDSSNSINLILLSLISAVISGGIEYFSVENGRWGYTLINPIISGISVIPIVQMAVINPLAIVLARKISLRNLAITSNR